MNKKLQTLILACLTPFIFIVLFYILGSFVAILIGWNELKDMSTVFGFFISIIPIGIIIIEEITFDDFKKV